MVSNPASHSINSPFSIGQKEAHWVKASSTLKEITVTEDHYVLCGVLNITTH